MSLREYQVPTFYETVIIVYLHNYQVTGTVESLGAYASLVKYKKDNIDYEELIDNSEFAILDEFVFERTTEE